jgi:hypothetical protein
VSIAILHLWLVLIEYQSRRQYILQFEKWGLHKYNTTRRVKDIPARVLSQSTQVVLGESVRNDPSKRRNSFHSVQSSRSALSQASAPKKKKPRYEQDLELPKSSAEPTNEILMLDFDSSDRYRSHLQNDDLVMVSNVSQIQSNLDSKLLKPTYQEASASDNFLNSWKESSNEQELVLPKSPLADRNIDLIPSIQATIGIQNFPTIPEQKYAVQGDARSLITEDQSAIPSSWTDSIDTASSFSLPERWTYVDDLVRVARQFDPNRPIDTFTEQEIGDMKLAADYLSILHFNDEACYLYALVAKRFRADDRMQTSQGLSTLVNFAGAALSKADKAISHNIIQEQLDGESNNFKKFLWHMASAYLKLRTTRPGSLEASAAEDLRIGRIIYETEDILSLLPNDTRALDLVVYKYAIICNLLSTAQFETYEGWEVFNKFETFSPDQVATKLSQQIMRRSPGPFEIEDGKMKSPCLRSCIAWCINELPQVKSLQVPWKSTIFPKYKLRRWFVRETQELEKIVTSLAEVLAIFTSLWDRCRNPTKSSSESDESNFCQWINECDTRMGLSPAMLLRFVCDMTHYDYHPGWKASKQTRTLVQNTINRLQSISELQDEALVELFLEHYVVSNTYYDWFEEKHAMQELSRAHVFEICRKTMMIIVPERVSAAFSSCGTPKMSLGKILPTLAPSLNSESFRKMKGMWNRSVGNLSISQLSDMMANSFKISDS